MPIPKSRLKPMWETTDGETVRLYQGDVLPVLNSLPERSVQCVVTSPPYWGLRDYGADKSEELGSEPTPDCLGWARGEWCDRCHVCRMVAVFRGVRRVLRDDGTCWLNYGDSYNNSPKGSLDNGSSRLGSASQDYQRTATPPKAFDKSKASGLAPGNLVGVPWRVALALQADGWILRQDVIWHKPAPMPESVRNRCTKAHEYVFLLTKSNRYYCDMEAIRENLDKTTVRKGTSNEKLAARTAAGSAYAQSTTENNGFGRTITVTGSNKRSVWTVSSQGYPGAHFATFPPRLIEPMIKAGTSEYGCCAACGTPWRRVTSEERLRRDRPNEYVKRRPGVSGIGNTCANDVAGVSVKTVGWRPGCECHGKFVKRVVTVAAESEAEKAARHDGKAFRTERYTSGKMYDNDSGTDPGWMNGALSSKGGDRTISEYVSDLPLSEHPVVPCVVLDPFMGSGTVADVCVDLGRRAWGVELNEGYVRKNQIPRVEGALMRRGSTAGLIPGRGAKAVKLTGRLV